MRELDRTERICGKLEKAWSEHPQERLGQFLANHVFGHHVDIFYQEDDVTEERLNEEETQKSID